ncbi:MAG: hypothetical protein JF571_02655 [Asticcacaulis sp.]|nr:hypothetical protein [Asticcacaulis sp.]
MSEAQRHAAAVAFQHQHPLFIIGISTGISIVIVSIIVLVRWLMSMSAWPYHPRGAAGFLIDEAVRLGVIFVPWVFLGVFFKYYIYELHPELNTGTTWGAFAICAIAIRMLLRRLPAVKAMARHIDAARAQAKAAKLGVAP